MNAKNLKNGDVVWHFNRSCLPKCCVVVELIRHVEDADYEVVRCKYQKGDLEKTEVTCSFFLWRSEEEVAKAVRSHIAMLNFWLEEQ